MRSLFIPTIVRLGRSSRSAEALLRNRATQETGAFYGVASTDAAAGTVAASQTPSQHQVKSKPDFSAFDMSNLAPSSMSDSNRATPAPVPPQDVNETVFIKNTVPKADNPISWSEVAGALPHDTLYGERADMSTILGAQQLFEQVRFTVKESLDAKHNWASPLQLKKSEELRETVRAERIKSGTGPDAAEIVAARVMPSVISL